MKTKTSILILLFISLFSYSQDGNTIEINEKNICGKWEFSDIINSKFSKEEIEERKSLMEGIYIQFNENKTCITSFVFDLEGTWKLDSTTKKITTTDRKGTNTWTIHSLKTNTLVVSRDNAEMQIKFKKE